MAITKNTAVTATGLARLLAQFKGKPRMEALLSAWLDECQEVENALWDVYFDRNIDNDAATGDLLAKLGKLVGQGSEGLSDALYRLLIQARIKSNRSTGKREELIDIAALLVPGDAVYVQDYQPASVVVNPLGALTLPPELVGNSFLIPAAAAGVELSFVWSPQPQTNTIILSSIHGGAVSPTTTQSPGSIHAGSFSAGPPVANDGGGVLSGVVSG